MNQYFFALGTNHTLSKIDIMNMLVRKGVDFEIIEASEEILIISTETKLDVKTLMNELGSAAKIGEIFEVYQKDNWPGEFLKDILDGDLKEKFRGEKFGVSIYGAGGKFKELNEVFYSTRKVAEVISKAGAREVRKQQRILSTVTVDKNRLLKDGLELVLCVGSRGIYVGRTLALQDYKSYSFRDFGRPARDPKSGMIPPKLAKMMINLAAKDKEDVFLDPFCGSGTILQELILLGYKNIIGSDVELRAIRDAKINLEWLFKNYSNIKKEDCKIKLFECNAENLSLKIPSQTIDAIVTEPYLGSTKRRFFNLEQLNKEIAQLENLYLSVFGEFKKVLKDDGIVVIIFPVFRYRNKFFLLQILNEVYSLGFRSSKFLMQQVEGSGLLKLQLTDRNSVIFFRPSQNVSREIFVFEKAGFF